MTCLQYPSSAGSATLTYVLDLTDETTQGTCGTVFILWKSSVTALTNITDNATGGSQTYTQRGATIEVGTTDHYSIAAFTCSDNASGVSAITANFAVTGAPCIMWYAEETDIILSANPWDSTAPLVWEARGATPWSTGAMAATTNPDCVLYCFAGDVAGDAQGLAPSGSWGQLGTNTPEVV